MPTGRETRCCPRIRWRLILLAATALIVVTTLCLALAVTCRPGWYRPASIDRARLHTDKTALFELQDNISGALNTTRQIRVHLNQDQVNRWLAARAELEPFANVDLGPIQHPYITFTPDTIRAAALVDRGLYRGIVSVECHPLLTDAGLTLKFTALHAGSLPVPTGWLVETFAHHLTNSPGDSATIRLENDFLWPNGKRRFKLCGLHIGQGELEAVLEPRAMHP